MVQHRLQALSMVTQYNIETFCERSKLYIDICEAYRVYLYRISNSLSFLISYVQMGLQHVKNMSLCAKVFSVFVVVFYLLSYAPYVEDNLAMTPA